MKSKTDQIIIIGIGETAEIAYEYFTHDSPHDVAAFSVDKQYITSPTFLNLPVIDFNELEHSFSPRDYMVYVAVSYTQLNRVRTRLYLEAKKKGYTAASYVSSKAFVWRTVEIGENCFIFENNVIQHGVRLGNNITLWSGNHIGHRTTIHDNCYIASHVVVSGFCTVGENCFIGVNSCINDRVTIARDCIIGSGAVITRDTEPGRVYVGNPAKPLEKSSFASFNVKEEPGEVD